MIRYAAPVAPLLALFGLIAFAPQAEARPGWGPPDPAKREAMHKRMVELRARILRGRVGLDDDTAARAEAVLASFDDERRALHDKKRKARKSMRALFESESDDQDAYRKAIAETMEAEEAMHRLRRREVGKLGAILTPRQQATLLMSLRHAHRKLKRKMRRGRRGGQGGGGPHGAGPFGGGPDGCPGGPGCFE